MQFVETRGNDGHHSQSVNFSEAILSPIASFGGLYSPKSLPLINQEFLQSHVNSNYKTLSRALLDKFEIDIGSEVIDQALALYDQFDDNNNPVPVIQVKPDLYISELYHGPTRAFKDMALQPFGKILSSMALQQDKKYLILVATSGDTGPAALETFKNKPNIQVVCLYPEGGTSDVQRLQMVTESADNLKVFGIHGDFDDAQRVLKQLLASTSFKQGLQQREISLSAANSVNFGRIIFQIIYHIHSYLELVRQQAISMGEKIYLNVPSGNFGNALGGYYAWKMGLPVEKILISSNANNILTELIQTGRYDLNNKSVITTTSPAMDILKSSNVERVLFDLFGAERTKSLLQQLDDENYYQLSDQELAVLQQHFSADFCTDTEVQGFIKTAYEQGYMMDPHTATCFKTYQTKTEKPLKSIVYSTAEWTKFSTVIDLAISGNESSGDLQALKSISKRANIDIPDVIQSLFERSVVHDSVIDKEQIEAEILNFLDPA